MRWINVAVCCFPPSTFSRPIWRTFKDSGTDILQKIFFTCIKLINIGKEIEAVRPVVLILDKFNKVAAGIWD